MLCVPPPPLAISAIAADTLSLALMEVAATTDGRAAAPAAQQMQAKLAPQQAERKPKLAALFVCAPGAVRAGGQGRVCVAGAHRSACGKTTLGLLQAIGRVHFEQGPHVLVNAAVTWGRVWGARGKGRRRMG